MVDDICIEKQKKIIEQPATVFIAEFNESRGRVSLIIGRRITGWELLFWAPREHALSAAMYEVVQEAGGYPYDPLLPALSVTGEHSGCDGVSGRFEILELEYDRSNNQVLRFAANFEQKCGRATPSLGVVRLNSTFQ